MKLTQSLAKTLVPLVAGLAALTVVLTLDAQTTPGKAEVRAIKGHALYSVSGGPAAELKVGAVLGGGTIIKTAAGSTVDLFLGNSAGVVRITENSSLGLDKLQITNTGADMVIENQFNLPEGTMLFNVNKLSAASKYEVKLPNGVAGIKGTKGRLSSNAFIVLIDGALVYVHVPQGGNPTPYSLSAPPPVYFSPAEGVKPAPDSLVAEVNRQFGPQGEGIPELEIPPHVPPDPARPGDLANQYSPNSKTAPPPQNLGGAK
jgi:hypothetical protein